MIPVVLESHAAPNTLRCAREVPSTLDPLVAEDPSALDAVYDALLPATGPSRWVVTVDAAPGELWLALATGVSWADGAPAGADDVCATVHGVLALPSPPAWAERVRERVAGCRVERGRAVLTLRAPVQPGDLAFPVVPAHLLATDALEHAAVGASGRTATLRAGRWTVTGADGARVTVEDVPDVEAVRALLRGQLDAVRSVPPNLAGEVASSDDVALRTRRDRALAVVAVDPGAAALADPAVREALDGALDRRRLLADAFGIDAVDPNPPFAPVSGPFPQASSAYDRSIALPTASGPVRRAIAVTLGGERGTEPAVAAVASQLRAAGVEVEVVGARAADLTVRSFPLGALDDPGALVSWLRDDRATVLYAAWRASGDPADGMALHRYLAESRPVLFLWVGAPRAAVRTERAGDALLRELCT